MGLIRTIRTLVSLLASALIACVLIPLERWLERFFWLPFIRTPAEALLRPKRFFAQLQRFGSVPRSAKFVRLEYDNSRHSLEPDKAALRAALRLEYVDGGETRTLAMFVKCGDGLSRGLPFWLVALSAHTGSVEVQFYRDLCADLPVGAPTALLAAEARLCSRFALVMSDCGTDARAFEKNTTGRRLYERAAAARTTYLVADRVGCSRAQALCVMRELAKLHAHFWNRAATLPEWLVAHRHGAAAGYLTKPGLGLVIGRGLRKWRQLDRLFSSLKKALKDEPATLLHGDCRPENLLFHNEVDGAWSLTFVDWEAVGCNPAANDLVYFIVVGLAANDAVAWESDLLDAYHGELSKALAARGLPPYSADALRESYLLLSAVFVVVQAVFAIDETFKGWGNHKENFLVWKVRIARFVTRLDVPKLCALLAKRLGAKTLLEQQNNPEVKSAAETLLELQKRARLGLEALRNQNDKDIDAL